MELVIELARTISRLIDPPATMERFEFRQVSSRAWLERLVNDGIVVEKRWQSEHPSQVLVEMKTRVHGKAASHAKTTYNNSLRRYPAPVNFARQQLPNCLINRCHRFSVFLRLNADRFPIEPDIRVFTIHGSVLLHGGRGIYEFYMRYF